MRKFIFITLAAAFFALSASADDGLSVKSFRWKDGEYVGDATKNVPNGKGRLVMGNGDIYEGDFVKGKRQGYGVLTLKSGEKYEGQWFNNEQHGRGIYYYINNNRCTITMATYIQEIGKMINEMVKALIPT